MYRVVHNNNLNGHIDVLLEAGFDLLKPHQVLMVQIEERPPVDLTGRAGEVTMAVLFTAKVKGQEKRLYQRLNPTSGKDILSVQYPVSPQQRGDTKKHL